MTANPGARARYEPAERLALVGLVGLHLTFAALLFDFEPAVGGDNAHYMILAESIGSGQGYRDIHTPDAPNHAQYPPLYPLVLAVVGGLGGGLLAFKVLSLLFTAGSVAALYLLARARLSRTASVAVALPLALNPVLLDHAHWVLSEALFVLCVLLALAAAERGSHSTRWFAAALIAALLAFATRFAGIPLLVALALPLAVGRQWRRLFVVATAGAVAVGGWWLWAWISDSPGGSRYAEVVLLRDTYQPELGSIGPLELIGRMGVSAWKYVSTVFPEALFGTGIARRAAPWTTGLALVLATLVVLGWLRGVTRTGVTEWFGAGYFVTLCLWPDDFATTRYFLPLFPIALLLAMNGAQIVLERLPGDSRPWALPALGGALALLALPADLAAVQPSRHCAERVRGGEAMACRAPRWQAFAEMARWARENTPEDAIIVARKPRLFYLLSGRRSQSFPFTSDADDMLHFLDGIEADYLVLTAASPTTTRYLFPVIEAHPSRFPPVVRIGKTSQPTGYVVRYMPDGSSLPPSR